MSLKTTGQQEDWVFADCTTNFLRSTTREHWSC